MKIVLLVEGKTETVFLGSLRTFLVGRCPVGAMPKLDAWPYDGRIPKGDKLRRVVADALTKRPQPADAVIALTDVYTGTADFSGAADAKQKMQQWAGDLRFYPHVALHDFEAWLLPFWPDIQRLAKHNKTAPSVHPEAVNHNKPPSKHIAEIFEAGGRGSYVKPRDARRILEGKDLAVAANVCPELKALLNTVLVLSGCERLP